MSSRKAAKIVSKLPEPWSSKTTGRPPHDARMVVMMCILKVLLCRTYDALDELADDPRLQHIFGAGKLPGHSVVHRGMKKLPMSYIRLLNKGMTKAFELELVEIIVDSTGFRLINSSSWYDIRIGRENKRKDNIKLHIICCANTGMILCYRITGWKTNDSPVFKHLTGDLKRFEKAIGNAGYLSVENCRLVARKGAKPYFMIKKNVGLRIKDDRAAAWNNMILEFRANKIEWLDTYHARSYVEAVFSSIKRCFGSTVKSMKKRIQHKELSLKVTAYNIKQALYVECSRLWELDLWVAP